MMMKISIPFYSFIGTPSVGGSVNLGINIGQGIGSARSRNLSEEMLL